MSGYLAMSEGYDEDSIKVLSKREIEEFSFAAAERLSRDYPHVPSQVIERMLTAAQWSGESRERVIGRYLDGDRSIILGETFFEVYRELMEDERKKFEGRA
jgi:hypothetical protein